MIRRLPAHGNTVYLTFDDGPDSAGTSRVLEILARHEARATFFAVASRLEAERALVHRVLDAGHALGNHSFDHGYRAFFRGSRTLRAWWRAAEDEFARLRLPRPVGFRPPAGVVTPPLVRMLREEGEPLVLWSERFFDSTWPWPARKAELSAARLRAGDIVLLHDLQKPRHLEMFCRTLDLYLGLLRARGFLLEPLTRELLRTGPLACGFKDGIAGKACEMPRT